MKALVTGASGFLGSALVPRLIDKGYEVRTFGRSSLPPRYLTDKVKANIEHVSGDITNVEQISKAMPGCEIVFHLAGLVSYRRKDERRQHAVNVLGTKNVMAAAMKSQAKRVIHASSIAAMGLPPEGTLGDESIEYNLYGHGLNYCDSKHEAEIEVKLAYKEGLNVLMLNPGIVFGEGDTHPHHHAIFSALSRGSMIGVPKGGIPFSDINDIVDAFINSITMGSLGDRYCLVSANLSFSDAAAVFTKVMNAKPPLCTIPNPLLVGLGTLSENLLPLIGKTPSLTRQSTWLSCHKIFFSSAKAERELNFRPTDFESTVRRTAPYYLAQQSTTSS